MKTKILQITIIALCVLGLFTSAYLEKLYVEDDTGICDINDKFSCSSVKNSLYSSLFGISVPIIGMIGYLVLGIGALLLILKQRSTKKVLKKKHMFWISLMGLVFSLYLTYAELAIIKTFCVFCITSQVLILAITILFYFAMRKN